MPKPPFLYYPVRKSELKQIAAEGLDADRQHFSSLKEARQAGGRVLVVSEKAVERGVIRPKDIGNLSPFRRAVRIQAGGGVLLRTNDSVIETVLIFRRGKWDIPKGKRDRGESKKECALREVREELGIEDGNLRLLWKAGKTTHVYKARKRRFAVKETHWYVMTTEATEFVPQAKENITDARWMPLKEARRLVQFKVLRDLLKDVSRQIKDKKRKGSKLVTATA